MENKKIKVLSGNLELPAFFPDGTYGVVKSVNSKDLENINIAGMVTNTFHLINKLGMNNIKNIGGIHKLINFNRPMVSDSGGFQVFSLIRENPKNGEIRDNEIIFRYDDGSKLILTPEKCIQMQFALGTDIIMCLDYCTHPDDSYEINEKSVETTIKWAKRCKEEYNKQIKLRKYTSDNRPLLFGIIQGGNYKDLRKKCAEELIKLDFDGFGFGGWPLDKDNNLIDDILKYTADLMPEGTVKYAMGLGRPEEIVRCVKMGYNLFDCVIPTREARHNRLYVFNEEASLDENFYSYMRILDKKYVNDLNPVDKNCNCECCKNYTRAYMYHLFKIGDSQADRLATIHNLTFFTNLMEKIKNEK